MESGTDMQSKFGVVSSYYGIILAFILAFVFLLKLRSSQEDGIPTINSYPGDWTLKKAHAAFISNARGLILEGFQKYQGPFRIITTLGSRVVLPAEYAEWVKKNNDLDHQAFVSEEFFAGYPGFEGTTAVSDPSGTLIKVVKTKLAQSNQIQKFFDHVSTGVSSIWGDETEWHDARWAETGVKLIGLMSASVFVGDKLAQNASWQQITTTYAVSMFMATRALRSWPRWTRPFIHWFLPACRLCRAEVQRAREILRHETREREVQREKSVGEGNVPNKYDDTITWMEEASSGGSYDPVAAQLGFAMAAIVTTSELLKQTLIEIAAHPELIAPLRKEIETSISASGWTTAGLFNMSLLDSVIKETQRLNSLSEVNLERKALRDVRMPNGMSLPRGTNISVHVSRFRDADVYHSPDQFDGYRYVKLRQEGGKWAASASAVSTSADHFVFGLGKPICPGRFFAIAEVKTALSVILLNFDVRLKPGYTPKNVRHGFEILSDFAPCIEVKQRSE